MKQANLRNLFSAALLCSVFAATSLTHAAVLTGSGPHLPIPSPNPAWPPGVPETRIQTGPTFVGSWGPPAHPAWNGFYIASGQIPSAFATGTIRYDFTTLPLGYLPAGTFFSFGDIDGGSGNPERFHIEAFDSSNNTITTEWLDDTFAVTGTGTGSSGTILSNNMPGWDWNVANPNEYQITGASVTGGNPNVAFALVTNQPIYRMSLEKPTTHYGFGMQAPEIPEPATVTMLLVSLASMACRFRNPLM